MLLSRYERVFISELGVSATARRGSTCSSAIQGILGTSVAWIGTWVPSLPKLEFELHQPCIPACTHFRSRAREFVVS